MESIFSCFLMIFVCSVAASPAGLCSNGVNQSVGSDDQNTTLVDLNDDCLFETMAYMDIGDLESLANTKPRFKSIAQHMLTKKALKAIYDWRQSVTRDREDVYDCKPEFEENALKLIRELKPVSRFTDNSNATDSSQKLVLLFKFLQYNFDIYGDYSSKIEPEFIDSVKSFVETHEQGQKENQIEDFAHILTLTDHFGILSNFRSHCNQHTSWLYYAYMMVLEKSKGHLKNQFPYAMMQQINKVRNAVNVHHLLQTLRNDSQFEYVERFKLDWDLYEGERLSDEAVGKFHLTLAREESQRLYYYLLDPKLSQITTPFVHAYCAIRNLPTGNFGNLVESSKLNLAIFDLAVEENKLIEEMRESLETECKGTKVIETGFQHQLKDLNRCIGDGDADNFFELQAIMTHSATLSHFEIDLKKSIEAKIEDLANATDFSEYITLLKTCTKLASYNSVWTLMRNALKDLYHEYFKFVNRPKAFDNFTQLAEVDRIHNELVEELQNYLTRVDKQSMAKREEYEALLNTILKNFDPILSPKDNDPPETRLVQRVLMKMLFTLADGAFNVVGRSVDDDRTMTIQLKIIKLFARLIQLDGETLSQDSTLWRHFYEFHRNLNENVKFIYTREDVEEFSFVYQPYKVTTNIANDAVVYLFHLHLAQNLRKFDKNIPDQVLANIFDLEENVGDAAILDEFLRSDISSRKFKFYEIFSDEITERQEKRGLQKFVDSKADLILNGGCYSNCAATISKSIFNAVVHNKENARDQLGPELIQKLRGCMDHLEYENQFFEAIREDYEKCKEILEFKPPISMKW